MVVFLLACISKKPINLYTFEADSKHLFIEVDIHPVGMDPTDKNTSQDSEEMGYNGPYFFMVDTGASTSIINQRVSRSLGLQLNMKEQPLVGLGGIHTYYTTDAMVSFEGKEQDVQFAVGVQGLPEQIKGVPISGILGNDFFEHYIVELDYPKHRLQLYSQDEYTWKSSKETIPMSYHSRAIHVDIELKEEGGENVSLDAILDTGAQYVLLRDSDIPSKIRRVPTQKYLLGLGSNSPFWVKESMLYQSIRFRNNEDFLFESPKNAYIIPNEREGYMPQNIIGSEVFTDKTLLIDYQNQQLQIQQSSKGNVKHSDYDISNLMLNRIRRNPDDYNLDVKLQILVASRNLEEALDTIKQYEQMENEKSSPRITNFKLQILMLSQKYDEVAKTFSQIEEENICDVTDLRSVLYSLAMSEDQDYMQSLLQSDSIPCIVDNLRLQSDLYMLLGSYERAFEILLQDRNSSSEQILLRKAILSNLLGKDLESISYLRSTLQNERTLHSTMYIYIDQYHTSEYRNILTNDLEGFHSNPIVLDMQTWGWMKLDQKERALDYMRLGLQKDCQQLQDAQHRNCIAWYEILADENMSAHSKTIRQLIDDHPYEASFLDTYAMILYNLGEKEEAKKYWRMALVLSPDSEYMLYQYIRSTL
jgi:tetratricopeptide (TPR) repeat protein/predicted aspartyl protease